MTKSVALPQRIESLVVAHLPTIMHVEALLLLRGRAGTAIDAGTVAAALSTRAAATAAILADLCGSGLVVEEAPGALRYAPRSNDLREAVDELAEVHRTRFVLLSRLIHEQAGLPRAGAATRPPRKG